MWTVDLVENPQQEVDATPFALRIIHSVSRQDGTWWEQPAQLFPVTAQELTKLRNVLAKTRLHDVSA